MAAFEGDPEEKGIAELLIPSGFCLVPIPTEDEEYTVELLQMQIAEKDAILDDRRLRMSAMEAALHAAHHDDRPVEVLFDVIYDRLRGGS